jgi:elongation factor Ts
MTTISAAMVKDLRDKTGAGMMDCKNALTETGGDIEAAIDWLRKKGLAKAAKKAGRVAADGLIGVAVEGNAGAMVEVNAETDFVARNETFQHAVGSIAQVALKVPGALEALTEAAFPGAEVSIGEHITNLVAKIGENITFRRVTRLEVKDGIVASYVHNAVAGAGNLGKIGILVALESTGDKARLAELGKQLAMHIAANSPLAVGEADVPADVVARERKILEEQAKESGRPDNVIEKMVEGRMRKFFEESVLLKQAFVMDPDKKVEAVIAEVGKEIGAPITVAGFERFGLGEGIEKEEADFAAEVAAAVKG